MAELHGSRPWFPGQARSRVQRWTVLVALIGLAVAMAVWPRTADSEAAHAAQACGPGDANRWHTTVSSGTAISPCLAKVNLHLAIAGSGGGTAFTVRKIGVPSSDVTVRYADGSTESNLVHVTFSSFTIVRGASMRTTDGSGYSLSILPAARADLGGPGVTTDLYITGSSTVTVKLLGVCIPLRADLMASLNWLVEGTDWDGCAMDADVRFLASQGPAGADSIALPDTAVEVGS